MTTVLGRRELFLAEAQLVCSEYRREIMNITKVKSGIDVTGVLYFYLLSKSAVKLSIKCLL